MRALPAAVLLLLLAPSAAAQLPLPIPANPLAGDLLVHRNTDVEARMDGWAAEFPEFVTVASAGQSTLGLDLWLVTLQHPNASEPWRIYLDGGHHGNEYFGTEFVMAYLGILVEGYRSGDAAVLAFLQQHAVQAMPIVNPEGNAMDTRKNSRQVDLNRNYPFQWGGEGSGGEPTAGNYRGEGPASEPETQANIAAQEAWRPDVLVTMHTGIAEMYWPWSYTADPSPDDALWKRLEAPFEEASNGRLDAMQGAELYLTAGSSDDFAYATFGIPAFTIEVHEDQFTPVYPGGIGPEMADQLLGVAWLLEHTRHLGANLQVEAFAIEGGTARLALRNVGWGNASGVQLTVFRDDVPLQTLTFDVPAEGEFTATVQGVGDGRGLAVEGRYPRLLLNTSQVRTFTATPLEGRGSGGPLAPTPGVEAALLVAAAVAVAGLGRRR